MCQICMISIVVSVHKMKVPDYTSLLSNGVLRNSGGGVYTHLCIARAFLFLLFKEMGLNMEQ